MTGLNDFRNHPPSPRCHCGHWPEFHPKGGACNMTWCGCTSYRESESEFKKSDRSAEPEAREG